MKEIFHYTIHLILLTVLIFNYLPQIKELVILENPEQSNLIEEYLVPVWPYPEKVERIGKNETYRILNYKKFVFKANIRSAILEVGMRKYKNLTFYSNKPESFDCERCVLGLNLIVNSNNEELTENMDESYTLEINPTKDGYFQLKSETIWGALKGLETFSQLVIIQNNFYIIQNTPLQIQDKPRFSWRGLMIDTSRHFLKVETILKLIDAMSYIKLNVLHLHLVDAEAFPVEISTYPDLHKKGAYDKVAVYSNSDLQRIIRYATINGIRVIPEVDMPGHTDSWGKGYPSVLAKCPNYQSISPFRNNLALNPSINLVYDLINGILKDMTPLFKDKYFHLGADEGI
jgi:hexosaminidase